MIPIKRYQSCEAPKHVKQRHFVILRTVRKLFLRTENENIVDNTEGLSSPPSSEVFGDNNSSVLSTIFSFLY